MMDKHDSLRETKWEIVTLIIIVYIGFLSIYQATEINKLLESVSRIEGMLESVEKSNPPSPFSNSEKTNSSI